MGRKLWIGLLLGGGTYFGSLYLGERWGATDEEAHASLPGDYLIPSPNVVTTHAITIQAPPSDVWPWLIQAGYRGAGRAGWYTDAWWDPILDRYILPMMVPAKHLPAPGWYKSADRLIPELQHVAVDAVIPDGPPGTAWFTVREVEPERALVLYSESHVRYLAPKGLQETRLAPHGPFTWTFVLRPEGDGVTRFILRTRTEFQPRVLLELGKPLVYLADFLLARQLLRGFKGRAERSAGR
jgi:hypothetical protein